MQVIFLDIDGVLNRLGKAEEGRTTTRWRGFIGMETELVNRFNSLVEQLNVNVVLSSTWRLDDDWREEMKANGLTCQFLDKTPHLPGYLRGSEISAWVEGHPEVTKYAIIDDNSDMLPGQPFFQTSYREGLTEEIAQKIINYFKTA